MKRNKGINGITNNKGFTLVELIGVLIILVVIMLIGIPAITSLIKSSQSDISESSKQLLIDATKDYLLDKKDIYTKYSGNVYCISFEQLLNNGNLTDTQLNNVGDEYSTIKVIYNSKNDASYELAGKDCMEHYNNARLTIKGDKTIILKLKSDVTIKEFDNPGLTFTYYENDIEKSVDVTANVYSDRTSNLVITSSSLKTGEVKECSSSSNCIPQINIDSYTIKYEYNAENGNTYYAERTVKILDDEPPIIILDKEEEKISTSSKNYDIKAGITLMDNSGEMPELKVRTNLSLGILGTYTVTYTATDSSGNSSTVSKKVIVEKPDVDVIIDVKSEYEKYEINSRTYKEEDILNEVYAYDENGIGYNNKIKYTIRKETTKVTSVNTGVLGTYYITYMIDQDGIDCTGKREIEIEDTTKPVISFDNKTVYVYPDRDYPNVLDGVTVSDNSKEKITIKASVSKLTFPSGNTQKVKYTATDSSGNSITATRTYIRYDTPGLPVLAGGNSNWQSSNVSITISEKATNTEAIKSYEYYVSTSSTSQIGGTWITMKEDDTISLTENQHTYVFVRAVSNAGVKGTISAPAEVKIDKDIPTAPTITGGTSTWKTTKTTIKVSTESKSFSNIKNYQYYISTSSTTQTGGTWNDMTDKSVTVSNEGTKYVFVKAINNAGTEGKISKYQTSMYDGGTPTAPKITGGSSSWSKSSKTIKVSTESSSASGINKYQYYISTSSTTQTGGTWTDMTNKSVTVSNEGTNYIFVKAINNAGTEGLVSSAQTTKIDLSKPSISKNVSGKDVTISFTDNIGVVGWTVVSDSSEPSSYTTISATKKSSVTWTSTKAGTYYAWVKDVAGNTASISFDISSTAFCSYSAGDTWNFAYKGSVESFEIPCAGVYKLEIWGAQGGSKKGFVGGYGGYSYGNATFTKGKKLYIAVGGAASAETGGYNGGGTVNNVNDYCGTGGGGASHIATTNRGVLSNYSSYKSELYLVAGGGGGALYCFDTASGDGGAGGGTTGGTGTFGSYCGGSTCGYIGRGATQTGPGASADFSYDRCGNAGFGYGASAIEYCSGGGGGLYGGGASYYYGGAGGGSGYVNTSLLSSTGLTAGVQTGNGKARITLISIND